MRFNFDFSVFGLVNNEWGEESEIESSMRKIGNSDFSTKPTNFYNLDVIISVGYRVKSHQGVHFRKWATAVLKMRFNFDFSVFGLVNNEWGVFHCFILR
jgi:hypothetical protein